MNMNGEFKKVRFIVNKITPLEAIVSKIVLFVGKVAIVVQLYCSAK
jgi:hypothetical protein